MWTAGPTSGVLHLALPGRPEIRSYDRTGALVRIVRPGVPLIPLTAAEIDRFRGTVRADAEARDVPPGPALALVDALERPESLPPYASLIADRDGNLWAESYEPTPLEGSPREFHVIDETGQWLGTVDLPDDAGAILEIGSDYLATRWLDDLEVPFLRVYRLDRGA
jgi:hypothetical protein